MCGMHRCIQSDFLFMVAPPPHLPPPSSPLPPPWLVLACVCITVFAPSPQKDMLVLAATPSLALLAVRRHLQVRRHPPGMRCGHLDCQQLLISVTVRLLDDKMSAAPSPACCLSLLSGAH